VEMFFNRRSAFLWVLTVLCNVQTRVKYWKKHEVSHVALNFCWNVYFEKEGISVYIE